MDQVSLDDCLGRNVFECLKDVQNKFQLVEYQKIEDEHFVKAKERGFYLQASGGELVAKYRMYFADSNGYMPFELGDRGLFLGVNVKKDLVNLFGEPIMEIRSINIPGVKPTPKGDVFEGETYSKISAYYCEGCEKIESIVVFKSAFKKAT